MRRIARLTAALTLTAMPIVGVIPAAHVFGIQGTGGPHTTAAARAFGIEGSGHN